MVRVKPDLGSKPGLRALHSPPSQKMRISAWDALVWAYADENVRAVGGYLSIANDYSVRAWPESFRGHDDGHTATVRGFLHAHQDAVDIDAFLVSKLTRLDDDGKEKLDFPHYYAIVKAAEARAPMPRVLDLPTQRCVPVMVKRKGEWTPKLIYPAKGRKKEAILCELEIVGVPPAQIERAQRQQAVWHDWFLAFLDHMQYHLPLTKWIVSGRGLTDRGESLTQGVRRGAVRREADKASD